MTSIDRRDCLKIVIITEASRLSDAEKGLKVKSNTMCDEFFSQNILAVFV